MDSSDPNQLAVTVLQYATSGNWRALAALGVLAVVFAIRQWALRPSLIVGVFPWLLWFKTDRGGVALNFIVSSLGGVGNALLAKQPLTVNLMLTAAVNACIAAGVFVSVKRLAGRPAEAAAAPPPVPPDAATTTPVEPPK